MTRARELTAGTFEQATGGVLKLETSDTTVTDGSVLGKIEFKAPDEASGTDANLTAAAIEAVAEGTFAADNNATELVFKTGASAAADTKMTLTSGGNLGIGVLPETWNGLTALQINSQASVSADGSSLQLGANCYYNSAWKYINTAVATNYYQDGGTHVWRYAASGSADAAISWSEAMRIDSSGNVLVGKTSANSDTAGFEANASGFTAATRSNGTVFVMDRLVSDGTIIDFRKANTSVGSIGAGSSRIAIGNGDTFLTFAGELDAVYPASSSSTTPRDNAIDIGTSGTRFDDIFATNGTIQTSDRNEKQDIASLTSAEMLVAKRISALFKTFRWKDKVAAKGANARTHTGIIAQDVQSEFTAESLDSGNYSVPRWSTWWEHDVDVPAVEAVAEVTDEDGNVITEAVEAVDAYTRTDTYDTQSEAPEGATSKTRMGIRYPELLSFLAAYNEQRFASIETRLTALEG